MNDEEYTPALGTWLKDTEVAPPDPQTSARRIMTGLPEREKRRSRWPYHRRTTAVAPPATNQTTRYQPSPIPATNGRTPTAIGRTSSMLSPVKAITAGALVFAIGGVLLIAQPFDQQGGVPGAETETSGEVTSFDGVMQFGFNTVTGVRDILPNGVVTNRGQVWTLSGVEMSDPRLEGTVSNMWNWDEYRSGDQHTIWIGGFRIVNDDGAWQMRPGVNLTFPDGTLSVWTGIFDGEGDYEGLTAIAEVTESGTTFSLRGIVTDGDVPPPPEAMNGG